MMAAGLVLREVAVLVLCEDSLLCRDEGSAGPARGRRVAPLDAALQRENGILTEFKRL